MNSERSLSATRKAAAVCFCVFVTGLMLSFPIGCVEQSTELTTAQRERLRSLVSTSPPTPQNPLSVSFENKVELVGYDVSGRPRSGTPFEVTWHWKVNQALDSEWRLFTHVADAADVSRLNLDAAGFLRENDVYQPGRWKAGEYIRDVQPVSVPADWNSEQARFYIGLYAGEHRLRILRGPNDGENRARAATVELGSNARSDNSVPGVSRGQARRTASAPSIDGQLSEPAWNSAPSLAFVDTMGGGPAAFTATAKMLWDTDNLYVGFDVQDDFLKSSFTDKDDRLWEADVVEIMVDPDGDGQHYVELQVSPRGVTFDTRFDRRRTPPAPGHIEFDSGMEAAANARGRIDDDESDQGYSVEVRIPWTAFTGLPVPASVPSAGDRWRFNFFVLDARAEGQRAAAWSAPREGDFHALGRFGQVVFEDTTQTPGRPQAPIQEPTTRRPAVKARPRGPTRPGPGEQVPTGPTGD